MTIKYDENFIKKPLEPVAYTQEMVLELKKCSEDITHFLKYCKIVHPDLGRITFEPYKFQETILQTVMNNRFTVILCARQAGKCVQSETQIRIRNKNTGIIENISMKNLYNRYKKN